LARYQHKSSKVRLADVDDSEKLQQTIISESRHVNCDEWPVSDHAPVKLPEFEHFLTGLQPPSVRPITELGDSSDAVDADQLETERVDFGDVVPRFQQNVAWPSTSDTQSSSAASDGRSHCNNELTRNSSGQYKSAEVTVSKKKDRVAERNSYVPVSQVASAAVSATDDPSSSDILRRLNAMSQQLAAQVIR